MRNIRGRIICTVSIFCMLTTPAMAIVGAGFHWGFDFSLKMDDRFNKPLSYEGLVSADLLDNIQADVPNFATTLPITLQALKDSMSNHNNILTSLPITLSRSDWDRSIINMGGKVFLDAIPIIDALEISFNIGAWEYDAMLKYPNGNIKSTITQQDVNEFLETGNYENLIEMDSIHLTLDNFGLSYLKIFGISKTPYTKVHFDVSIRKNIVAVPDKMKLFKLYAGGGPSLHLGTPIMTPEFVEDVIASTLENAGSDFGNIGSIGTDGDLMKTVVNRLIKKSKTPTFGMHLLIGTMAKLPVIPVGIYADMKLMIPFGDLDDNVDIGGVGFLFNTGVSLSF